MYKPSKYAVNNPVYINIWDKRGVFIKSFGVGIEPAKGNQKEYKYARSIGLTKWVDEVSRADEK